MVSWQHKFFDRVLRLIRFRQRYWAQYDGVKTPKRERPSGWIKKAMTVGQKSFEDMPFYWLEPANGATDGYIIALHGGGYVAEGSKGHWDSYAKLVNLTGKRVYFPFYPLAPFHSPKAIREWTERFVEHVREHRPDDPLLMIGDSAGANLALQMTEMGVPVDRLVLWSPWVDIEGANPEIAARDGSCALLRAEGLKEFSQMYHGETDPRDPMISPIFRETESLPPTLILSGDQDLFHPDIEAYASKRAGQGQPVELRTEEGVWHDYMLMPTPESKRALKATAAFLQA
jgi:acetyl esterase/lipase